MERGRRRFLGLLGTAVAGGSAGCSEGVTDDSDGPTAGARSDDPGTSGGTTTPPSTRTGDSGSNDVTAWPMKGGDAANTGRYAAAIEADGSFEQLWTWSYTLPDVDEQYQTTVTSPVHNGDDLFVAAVASSGNGPQPPTLTALGRDGEESWRTELIDEALYGNQRSPAVADGSVYTVTNGGVFVKSDTEGDVQNRAQMDMAAAGSVTVADEGLYAPSQTIHAFDREPGERWRVEYPRESDRRQAAESHPPAVANGMVYVPVSKSTLLALDAANGEREWVAESAFQESISGRPTVFAPVVDSEAGTVYAASGRFRAGGDGHLLALDTSTGEVQGRFKPDTDGVAAENRGPYGVYGSPAIGDGTLYSTGKASPDTGAESAYLFAVDANDLTEEWRTPIGDVCLFPVLADGAVVVASGTEIEMFDAETGDSKGTVETGERIAEYAEPVLDGERMYVTTATGIEAFRL